MTDSRDVDLTGLIGKTILTAKIIALEGYDDTPYLDLIFTDGTGARFEACYSEEWTGKSKSEYSRYLRMVPLVDTATFAPLIP